MAKAASTDTPRQTRPRKTAAQRAQAEVDKAQKSLDQANKRLEKATERQSKLANDVAEAQAEAQSAQQTLDYAAMHPALQQAQQADGGTGDGATGEDSIAVARTNAE
jgi:chromosome segregation ATPase